MSSQAARTAYIADMKAQLQELWTATTRHCCGSTATGSTSLQPHAEGLVAEVGRRRPLQLADRPLARHHLNERVKRGLGLGDFEVPESVPPRRCPAPGSGAPP